LFRSARQQLARALRWHRVRGGWLQEALELAAGLDRRYVGAVERVAAQTLGKQIEKRVHPHAA